MSMRRVISMALFIVLAFLPMQAQMRGGRGGGGSFHGGGGYHAGGAVASRGPVGMYRAAPQYPVRSVNRWGFYGGFHFGGHFYPHRHFYGYPAYYYPYYAYAYPYYAYPSYGVGVYGDYSSNSADSTYMQQLSNQVNSLSAEMQQLRDENDNLRDYIAERSAPVAIPDRRIPPSVAAPLQPDQPATQRQTQQEKPSIPTVLAFKDGHTVDAPNYAIVDNTIWVLTGKRATKVPLSQLDLEKTRQLNEQRGIEFAAPPAQ